MEGERNPIFAIREETLCKLIYTIRGVQVMLDSDLAAIYGVKTKVFNQAVKRNIARFPDSFHFQLTSDETIELVAKCDLIESLRSQLVTSTKPHGGRRYQPYVFTEQGIAMLSAVLRSETAIQTSINIINAFVAMRRFFVANGGLLQRVDSLEKRQFTHEINTDERFEKVFNALESQSTQSTQGVFFDGQIFDAYVFINNLLRQAKQSIVLIDNYVDDSVLHQFAKRQKNVRAIILTKTLDKALIQDLKKHNAQYPPITIREFSHSHDRFLIVDDDVYHIGASLKDLGKKWFTFSRMDKAGLKVMDKVAEVLGYGG